MLGRGQASPGFPRLPLAHSPARCGLFALWPLPSSARSLARAQGQRSRPASSPAGSGDKAGAGEHGSSVFSCISCHGQVGGWQGEHTFPARLAPGARSAARVTLHWHRWFITHWQAPSALLSSASSSTLSPAGITAREPPPPSHLPWPPCQPQRGGGLASSLSFLLWRARASPFPCQDRAGEFLPHFSQMLLPLAQASACISLSVVCWDPGSQRNWKSSQVDKSLRKGVSFNPKPTSMNLSG